MTAETHPAGQADPAAIETVIRRRAAAVQRQDLPAIVADPDTRLRLTVGLRREAGRRPIAHEQHSYPRKPA